MASWSSRTVPLTWVERIACFSALCAERALPSGVLGPWERAPLVRDASAWVAVRGVGEGPSRREMGQEDIRNEAPSIGSLS